MHNFPEYFQAKMLYCMIPVVIKRFFLNLRQLSRLSHDQLQRVLEVIDFCTGNLTLELISLNFHISESRLYILLKLIVLC